jgi:hypothetical protein
MFVIIGSVNVLVATVIWFCLAGTPEEAKFLTEEEKAFIDLRLKLDQSGVGLKVSQEWLLAADLISNHELTGQLGLPLEISRRSLPRFSNLASLFDDTPHFSAKRRDHNLLIHPHQDIRLHF